MGLKIFETEIDFALLQEMEQLISFTADQNTNSLSFIRLFETIQKKEPNLNFSYPGELLERYEEKYGSDISKMRALGIALLEQKDRLDAKMFIANQYGQFISKIRSFAKKDLYLSGILYLLTKKEKEKEDLFQFLLFYPYQKTHEIIFSLYILQNENAAWETLSLKLAEFLGKKRSLSWYGNLDLLAWVIQKFKYKLKTRRKGLELLKALFELPYKHIKKDSPMWNRLQQNGYSEQELLYINLSIPKIMKFGDALQDTSITMERMAVEACKVILNAEHVENPCLYDLCNALFEKFKLFKIQLEGNKGIIQILNGLITVKNMESFLFLWELKDTYNIPESFFYINIGEENKWDNLVNKIRPYIYRELFEQNFIYMYHHTNNFSITTWLKKYQTLTSGSYEDIFWKLADTSVSSMFVILVKENIINLLDLFKQYKSDEKLGDLERTQKWSPMAKHIYVKTHALSQYEDYLFWEAFIQTYSIDSLNAFLYHENAFFDALTNRNYHYYHNSNYNLNIIRNFLTKEEQYVLIMQFENYMFTHHTEDYLIFLTILLSDTSIQNMFPKTCRSLFLMLECYEDNSEIGCLRGTYYTKEELEEYHRKKEEEKKKKNEKETQERCQEIKNTLEEILSNAENKIEAISNFIKENYIKDKLAVSLSADYLVQELSIEGSKLSRKSIYNITYGLLWSYYYDSLEWPLIQTIINKMEEKNELRANTESLKLPQME